MSKLTRDCLLIIFEELGNDVKSLYSCLLVNRLWCETVVPILWKNPWKVLKNKYKVIDYSRRLTCLHETILSFLPPESRVLLSYININTPKPLLNYISYLKALNYDNIWIMSMYAVYNDSIFLL